MKKADFLKQENVPEFIKEIVRNAPDDAEVNVMGMRIPKAPTAEKGCSCGECKKNEDGVSVGAYIESLADTFCNMVDLCDDDGKVARSDIPVLTGYIDVVSGTLDRFFNFLDAEQKKG